MSSFTIETKTLQSMIRKVIKCASAASNNVITSLLNVTIESGVFRISKTDSRNFLDVTHNVDGDDIEFTVIVDTFSQIVSKITTKDLTITKNDDCIVIEGNGTYKIPIMLDGSGSEIEFPRYIVRNPIYSGTISKADIKTVLMCNKPSVGVPNAVPVQALTGYMCTEDSVITADTFRVCITNLGLFNTYCLIPESAFDLLGLFDSDVEYVADDECVEFKSGNMRLFTSFMNDRIDEFPLEKCEALATSEFPSSCVLNRTAVLSAVDRLSLFIKQNDDKAVRFNFNKNGVILEAPDRTAVEQVDYMSSTDFSEFSCLIKVDSIKKLFNARSGDAVNIYYGLDKFIVIKDSDITSQVSALLKDRY